MAELISRLDPKSRAASRGLSDLAIRNLFVIPTIAFLIIFNIFPLIYSLGYSFTDFRASSKDAANFVGLQNYRDLLADPFIWTNFTITAKYVIVSVTGQGLVGFGLALLLDRSFPFKGPVTTLLLLPMMLSMAVVGLNDNHIGLIILYTAFNVSFAVWLMKGFIDEIPREYEEAALVDEAIGIIHLLKLRPSALSGGDMQRVAIGRALERRPKALLMDEPIGAPDAKLREQMRIELKRLHLENGSTSIYVTHDQVEAMTMGDRMGVLNKGRIEQLGTPHEIYRRPRNTFVAGFVGSPAINLLAGRIEGGRAVMTPGSFEMPLTNLPEGAGGDLTFGSRPEDLQIVSGGPVAAAVHDVENHGTEQVVTLRIGASHLRASVLAQSRIKVEEQVRLGWTPDKVMYFDRHSGLNIGRQT